MGRRPPVRRFVEPEAFNPGIGLGEGLPDDEDVVEGGRLEGIGETDVGCEKVITPPPKPLLSTT